MELPDDTLRELCRLQVRVGEVCRASTAECTQSGVCGRVQDTRRSTFEASVRERTGPGTAWPLPKGMDSFHRAAREREACVASILTGSEDGGRGRVGWCGASNRWIGLTCDRFGAHPWPQLGRAGYLKRGPGPVLVGNHTPAQKASSS